MKAIQAHPQQGLDGLTSVDLPDPGDPRTGRHPRARACHLPELPRFGRGDGTVAGPPMGAFPWPMAPGWWRRSVPRSLGSSPATTVVSTFFPTWLDGEATLADFATTAGRRDRRLCPGGRGGAGHVLHACAGRLEPRRRGDPDHGRCDRPGAPWWSTAA